MDDVARQRALKILERRDVSRKMLVDRLVEKGASPEDAEEAADWLCGLGVVDDRRYAELLVRHYAGKGYGERRLRDERFRRGVPRELWEESLESMPETGDAVFRLLCRKLSGTEGSPEDLRRAQQYLLRRGFSSAEIFAAIDRYRSENEEPI